jgi:hypothetical protein
MYSRYLGVDISEYTAMINTESLVSVEGYQYLTNGAKYLPKQQRETRTTAARKNGNGLSWTPIILLVVIGALAFGAFHLVVSIQRLQKEDHRTSVDPTDPTDPTDRTDPTSSGGAGGTIPSSAALPEADPEVPKALPVSPAAAFARNDFALLSEFSGVAPAPAQPAVVASTGTAPPTPSPAPSPDPNTEQPGDDEARPAERGENAFLIEATRRVTVTIRRDNALGPAVFSGTLYPTAPPLRIPLGRYALQSADYASLKVLRNGQPTKVESQSAVIE